MSFGDWGRPVAASSLRTEVLVVGAGVVGAVLALELAHHGVGCVVVERSLTEPKHPDLDLLTGRSMELLRRLGLAAEVRELGVDPDSPSDYEWRQGLDQPPVLVSHYPSVNQLRGRYAQVNDGSAPVELHLRVPGARLAKRLRDAVREHPLIELREGWTFTGLRVDEDGVAASVLEVRGGVRHTVEARYVAGCDGAQSTVRRSLDVPMEQLGLPAPHCSVYFRSEDPHLHPRGRALSTIVVGGLTLVARDERNGWVGQLPVGADEPLTTDPVAMLRSRLGAALAKPEVFGVTQWDDSLAVAAQYRRGSVFLVGEAAHRFHPVTDNADTSIGDAVDLGWKLAAVLCGWGGPGLLASYELERRPRALMDRELLARALETRRRFGRLAAAGASREFLAGVLHQETHRLDPMGIQFAGRYAESAVIWHDRGTPPSRNGHRITPTTWPGGRAPAVRLADGTQLFDRLGSELTLVDLTEGGSGGRLVDQARRRGIPMAHLPSGDPAVLRSWDRPLVLVRPDQHVAWRAAAPPDDWDAVLTHVVGGSSLAGTTALREDHVNTSCPRSSVRRRSIHVSAIDKGPDR
ncbi:FAD-dependent monooxygenase [Dactylosporangium sp. AC04546]|uniref:FAD-dependent monooxygenase n=1 Tax=Dactylosporangium sp. AC04546 TaxID=2862460 RepID=UPI002E7BE0CF|nr:FAD-dependent monooxygenase [Dactylosporangium sp. AC04546]WVK87478.1 FAD-dependent monooxygenase [Dactylosporangium sp. AC04546]